MKQFLAILVIVFSTSCSPNRDLPDEIDIFRQEDTQMENIDLPKMKLVKPGETSEKDLYKIFGKKIYDRWTFLPVLPYKYRKKNLPIDKYIMYDGYKGNIIKTAEYTISKANTVLLVQFYLYMGSVQFYSIIDWDKESDIVTEFSSIDALEMFHEFKRQNRPMSIWGYERCTSKFYQIKMLHYDKKPNRTTNAHKETCYWEEPDFEKKLLENREYQDFLIDPHYGKKLLEKGYIPPAAKWKGK